VIGESMLANIITSLSGAGDIVGNIWPLFVLAAALFGGIKVMWKNVKREFTTIVETNIEPLRKEVTPNGGGSMKDSVKRVEELGAKLGDKLDMLVNGVDEAKQIATSNGSRLSAVIASIEAAYYEMDAAGSVIDVNDAYLELFNITEKQALSTVNWRNNISDDDLRAIDLSGEHAVKSKSDWYSTFTVNRDGVSIPVTARAKPIFNGTELVGFSGAMSYDRDLLPD